MKKVVERIIPQNDYILAEPVVGDQLERRSSSGLYLPAASGETPLDRSVSLAKAAEVGPGPWIEAVNGGQIRKGMSVKPGDTFVYRGKAPSLVVQGEHRVMVQDYQVIAILEQAEVEVAEESVEFRCAWEK